MDQLSQISSDLNQERYNLDEKILQQNRLIENLNPLYELTKQKVDHVLQIISKYDSKIDEITFQNIKLDKEKVAQK